jgi:hypothetical protein
MTVEDYIKEEKEQKKKHHYMVLEILSEGDPDRKNKLMEDGIKGALNPKEMGEEVIIDNKTLKL